MHTKDFMTISMYWYEVCTRLSHQHPIGSVEATFWWSLRFLVDFMHDNPQDAFTPWIEYLDFKILQYEEIFAVTK